MKEIAKHRSGVTNTGFSLNARWVGGGGGGGELFPPVLAIRLNFSHQWGRSDSIVRGMNGVE